MRPDRTVVVRQGVIAGFAGAEGAYPPTAVEVLRKERLCHLPGVVLAGNACKQRMTCIRGSDAARTFTTVKGHCVDIEIFTPESVFKLIPQLRSLLLKGSGSLVVTHYRTQARRG